jgi:hypothetical protein
MVTAQTVRGIVFVLIVQPLGRLNHDYVGIC